MPVFFYIDPDFALDPALAKVDTHSNFSSFLCCSSHHPAQPLADIPRPIPGADGRDNPVLHFLSSTGCRRARHRSWGDRMTRNDFGGGNGGCRLPVHKWQ